jgi:tripartite-type tricarboxylate transporter receptor subunit TctC
VGRILRQPDLRAKLDEQGFESVASTPEGFGQFIRAEIDLWAKAVKVSGARAD